MKTDTKTETEVITRIGIVDAVSAGVDLARRRPWLMLIPVIVDLWLWLSPRVSIEPLVRRMQASLQAMMQMAGNTASLASLDPVGTLQKTLDYLSTQFNAATGLIGEGITGGWLGAPSVVAQGHVGRLNFFGELVLAPLSLSPDPPMAMVGRPAALQVSSFGGWLLAIVAFWLIGQFLASVYLRMIGSAYRDQPLWPGLRGALQLTRRLAAFNLLIGLALVLVWGPLLVVTGLFVTIGGFMGGLAMMLVGVALWLTLWFLLATFFTPEIVVLDRQPLLRAMAQSAALVHSNFGAVLGLAGLVNVLLYGLRVIWGLIGVSPVGVVVGIVGNAFLATGMLLAACGFYENLRKVTLARAAAARAH